MEEERAQLGIRQARIGLEGALILLYGLGKAPASIPRVEMNLTELIIKSV